MYSFTRKALVNGQQFQHGDDASNLPKHLIERFLLAGMVIKTSVKPVEDSVKPVDIVINKPIVTQVENGYDVVLNGAVLGNFSKKKEAKEFADQF